MLGKAPLVYETGSLAIDTMRRELRVRGAPVPVGSRTFDIIEILVKSAGQLVTKDQLIAQVWPNAIVGDNTIQVHIHAIRKALGPDRAAVGLEQAGELAGVRGENGRRLALRQRLQFAGVGV